MTLDNVFWMCNLAVLSGWLLLVGLPRWKFTTALITSVLLPGLLALVYLYLMITSPVGADGGFGSLDEVASLFSSRPILLAGWIHYLAFDLFIGSWQVRDAQRQGIHHLLVIPCLLLTLMLGPIGLLSYLMLRGMTTRHGLINSDS